MKFQNQTQSGFEINISKEILICSTLSKNELSKIFKRVFKIGNKNKSGEINKIGFQIFFNLKILKLSFGKNSKIKSSAKIKIPTLENEKKIGKIRNQRRNLKFENCAKKKVITEEIHKIFAC